VLEVDGEPTLYAKAKFLLFIIEAPACLIAEFWKFSLVQNKKVNISKITFI
jgi:hypothetical protein